VCEVLATFLPVHFPIPDLSEFDCVIRFTSFINCHFTYRSIYKGRSYEHSAVIHKVTNTHTTIPTHTNSRIHEFTNSPIHEFTILLLFQYSNNLLKIRQHRNVVYPFTIRLLLQLHNPTGQSRGYHYSIQVHLSENRQFRCGEIF
jgi:hypothetical protein